MSYKIQSHGASGAWRNHRDDAIETLQAALAVATQVKNEGYGVRILSSDGRVVVNAPWQVELPTIRPIDWKPSTAARYLQMRDCVPPAAMGYHAFLVGEPYSHTSAGVPTFRAFKFAGVGYAGQDPSSQYFEAEPMTFAEFAAEIGGAEYYYRS